eukprot:1139077-Pelagomonas_calceolata.AAC.2
MLENPNVCVHVVVWQLCATSSAPTQPSTLPGRVAVMHNKKHRNSAIYLARWEVSRSEVRGRHAAAELSHIQLMHVTKDLQVRLRARVCICETVCPCTAELHGFICGAHAYEVPRHMSKHASMPCLPHFSFGNATKVNVGRVHCLQMLESAMQGCCAATSYGHLSHSLQAVLRNPMAMSRLDQETQLLALAEAAHVSERGRSSGTLSTYDKCGQYREDERGHCKRHRSTCNNQGGESNRGGLDIHLAVVRSLLCAIMRWSVSSSPPVYSFELCSRYAPAGA